MVASPSASDVNAARPSMLRFIDRSPGICLFDAGQADGQPLDLRQSGQQMIQRIRHQLLRRTILNSAGEAEAKMTLGIETQGEGRLATNCVRCRLDRCHAGLGGTSLPRALAFGGWCRRHFGQRWHGLYSRHDRFRCRNLDRLRHCFKDRQRRQLAGNLVLLEHDRRQRRADRKFGLPSGKIGRKTHAGRTGDIMPHIIPAEIVRRPLTGGITLRPHGGTSLPLASEKA